MSTLLFTWKELVVADTPVMYCTSLDVVLYTMKGCAEPLLGKTGDTKNPDSVEFKGVPLALSTMLLACWFVMPAMFPMAIAFDPWFVYPAKFPMETAFAFCPLEPAELPMETEFVPWFV
jgi:hypothetical protein